jgi:hypothetical protein
MDEMTSSPTTGSHCWQPLWRGAGCVLAGLKILSWSEAPCSPSLRQDYVGMWLARSPAARASFRSCSRLIPPGPHLGLGTMFRAMASLPDVCGGGGRYSRGGTATSTLASQDWGTDSPEAPTPQL